MRLKNGKTVRWLRNDTERGYGPDYVTDKGRLFATWSADCFDPPVYLFRCSTFEEALEHAEVVLGARVSLSDLDRDEMADLADLFAYGHSAGFTLAPVDGVGEPMTGMHGRYYWQRVGFRRLRSGLRMSTYVTDEDRGQPAWLIVHRADENPTMVDLAPPYDSDCGWCWQGIGHSVTAHEVSRGES